MASVAPVPVSQTKVPAPWIQLRLEPEGQRNFRVKIRGGRPMSQQTADDE
jgi:hypothetical protein